LRRRSYGHNPDGAATVKQEIVVASDPQTIEPEMLIKLRRYINKGISHRTQATLLSNPFDLAFAAELLARGHAHSASTKVGGACTSANFYILYLRNFWSPLFSVQGGIA
jgi:hypothetical protein